MAELNLAALPKWIMTYADDTEDIISYPVGSGNNVNMRIADANTLEIFFLDAGHSGTWLGHTRKDCKASITTTSQALELQRAITEFLAKAGTTEITNTGNARFLEIAPNATNLGVVCGSIVIDWDTTS
jgi:6-phosphogluconate dehydrogenase (decarboxylating)